MNQFTHGDFEYYLFIHKCFLQKNIDICIEKLVEKDTKICNLRKNEMFEMLSLTN